MIKELSDGSIKFVGKLESKTCCFFLIGSLFLFVVGGILRVYNEETFEAIIVSIFGIVSLCTIPFLRHQFTLSPTTILIRSLTERIIKLQEISSAKLFQDEELIFYDENDEEDDYIELSFFKQDDVQVFLNMLAKKGIVIDVAEEMKERGYVVPKNRHSKLSQQSQYHTKDTDEDTETTPHQRRRVVKTDDLDIDDTDSSRQKRHKRRLEF